MTTSASSSRVNPCPFLRRFVGAVLMATCVIGTSLAATEPHRDPLLEPPLVNTRPGPEYQDEVRVAGMIIGMDRTPQGRIWGCWTGTGDNHDAYFLLATSDDGGATWSRPRVVIDPKEIPGLPARYSLIGNLWSDPHGRMWLFFDQHMAGFAQTGWYITCDNPDAAQPTWSKATLVSDGSTLNKPLVLKSGEWLLPVSLLVPGRHRAGETPAEALAHEPMVHAYGSTDRGQTWTRRGGVVIPPAEVNHNEPMFVELRDGRLWMLLRTRYGIAESYSSDQGRTWTDVKPSTIQNPATRFYLRRLASGRLLLVKNGAIDVRARGRTHLTAFLSEDDGKTWGSGLLLDERGAVTYPDGFEAPDGLIRILYDWNRHGEGHILMASFRESDVLAGKLVSRDAKLRHLVNRPKAPDFSPSVAPDEAWTAQAVADAKLDFTNTPYDGTATKQPAADANLRSLADGSWALLLAVGDEANPKSMRSSGLMRSADRGKTWLPLSPLETVVPREGNSVGVGPVELALSGDRSTLFFTTHAKNWPDHWRTWVASGDRGAATWQTPASLGGRLATRTFVRNPIITRDGRLMAPFQHYAATDTELTDPRCGVIVSSDGGKTWTEHGNIRLAPVNRHFGWEESNLVELGGGRIVMLIRATGLMATTYRAESTDGGKTWPEVATLFRAPAPGSLTLYSLGGEAVAMIHNPAGKLALWVSFDGMKSWPYQRVLAKTSSVGPKEAMSHAHGFVSSDKAWLHFAFVDKEKRAVHYSAKLPALKSP